MSSLTRSTLYITAFSTAGLALGFLVNLVIAAKFGAGSEMDVYLAATTFPTLIAAILTGSLSSTFLPVFAEYREKDLREGWKIVSAFLNLATASSIAFCVAGIVFAEPLARAMTPGFADGQVQAAASLMRWLLPTITFTVVNELISSIYYSNRRFLEPMVIKVIGPAITIAYVFAFADSLSLRSVVFATLTAGLVQTAILMGGLLRDRSFHYSPVIDFRHPGIRRILALMVPLILGSSLYRMVPAFERWLASGLGTGTISHLGYATRLINVLQPILISGISITGFAILSDLVARRDTPGVRAAMDKAISMLCFLSVPCAFLLAGFARPLISLLFQRGAFTAHDAEITSMLFSLYALTLPATTVGTIISQGFYAYQDTRTPAVLGVGEIAIYVILCFLLAAPLGAASIPVSYGVYFYLSVVMLTLLLARKTGFSIIGLSARPMLQSIAASAAALGVGLLLERIGPSTREWGVACLGISFLGYFLIQKGIFRRPEADLLLELTLRKLPGWKAAA